MVGELAAWIYCSAGESRCMTQQMFWKNSRLYVVTGFNTAQLACETAAAEKLRMHWNTDYALAQLFLRGGFQLIQK